MASLLTKASLPLPLQGIRADMDDYHIPADALRSTSYNWIERDGKIVTRPGLTAFANIPSGADIPLGMTTFRDVIGVFHIVHATTDKWWQFNFDGSLTWEDLSDAGLLWSGQLDSPVIFRVFNAGDSTHLLGVNLQDTPRAWDTSPATNKFTLFGGSAPQSRTMAILADRVLLAGFVAPGHATVDVSAFQDHTTGWGVTQTTVLLETPGGITAMMELGSNQVAIYKESSIYLASGTSGLNPVRFDLHTSGIVGPASAAAVIPLHSTLHAILTVTGEVYLFDGVNYSRHPSSDRVRKLYDRDAETNINIVKHIHGFYDTRNNELWFFYTRIGLSGAGPQDAIVIKMDTGSVWKLNWTDKDLNFTTSYYGITVEQDGTHHTVAFLGERGGQFYIVGGTLDDGDPIDVRMETGLSPLGDPTQNKTIEETEVFFATPVTTETPTIIVTSSHSGEDSAASAAQTITLTPTSEGPYTNGVRTSGGERITARLFGVTIADDALTSPLEYLGASIAVAPRGFR